MKYSTCVLIALSLTSSAAAQIHVDDDATPGGNGATWSTAFNSLDDALNVASDGDQIWVAEGAYIPTQERIPGDPRSVSFSPALGVSLFGGFLGFETSLDTRAGSVFDTFLEGNIGALADDSDNAYHVVFLSNSLTQLAQRRTVDGFNIRNGFADGSGENRQGGGLYARDPRVTVENCVFEFNYASLRGGAFSGAPGTVSVLINDCMFRWNQSGGSGGALSSRRRYQVTNTVFFGNDAANTGGAVFALDGSRNPAGALISRYQNCLFQGNTATNGGAVYMRGRLTLPSGVSFIKGGMIEFSGCTFTQNIGTQSGAVIGLPSVSIGGANAPTVDMHNSIIWGNRSLDLTMLSGAASDFRVVDYSIVQGGWPGAGNLNQNPRFVNANNLNLRLQAGSPAIDAGNNGLILFDDQDLNDNQSTLDPTPFDFDGSARRRDDPSTPDTGVGGVPVVDMGAFEF